MTIGITSGLHGSLELCIKANLTIFNPTTPLEINLNCLGKTKYQVLSVIEDSSDLSEKHEGINQGC